MCSCPSWNLGFFWWTIHSSIWGIDSVGPTPSSQMSASTHMWLNNFFILYDCGHNGGDWKLLWTINYAINNVIIIYISWVIFFNGWRTYYFYNIWCCRMSGGVDIDIWLKSPKVLEVIEDRAQMHSTCPFNHNWFKVAMNTSLLKVSYRVSILQRVW